MSTLILKYSLAWNHKSNLGHINLLLKGSKKVQIKVSSPEEFNAIFAVLNNSPVAISKEGWIYNAEMEEPKS